MLAGHRAPRRARTRSWSRRPSGLIELEADVVLLSTGSRPRIPDWAPVDGRAGADHPRRLPAARAARAPGRRRVGRHRAWSSSTCSRRSAARSRSSSAASRCCPRRTPRWRPRSRTTSSSGACGSSRAPGPSGIDVGGRRSPCAATTVGWPPASHALLAIGSIPNSERLGPRRGRASSSDNGYVVVNHNCQSNGAAHLRRRRPVGQAAAVVGRRHAGPQDRRARHGPARRPPPPPRLREGGVGHLHRARDRRRGPGRGRRLRRRAARSG